MLNSEYLTPCAPLMIVARIHPSLRRRRRYHTLCTPRLYSVFEIQISPCAPLMIVEHIHPSLQRRRRYHWSAICQPPHRTNVYFE